MTTNSARVPRRSYSLCTCCRRRRVIGHTRWHVAYAMVSTTACPSRVRRSKGWPPSSTHAVGSSDRRVAVAPVAAGQAPGRVSNRSAGAPSRVWERRSRLPHGTVRLPSRERLWFTGMPRLFPPERTSIRSETPCQTRAARGRLAGGSRAARGSACRSAGRRAGSLVLRIGERAEIALEGLAVGLREIHAERHVLRAGCGREAKPDLVEQSAARRGPEAQLPRELSGIRKRQQGCDPRLVAVDAQLQRRRTARGAGTRAGRSAGRSRRAAGRGGRSFRDFAPQGGQLLLRSAEGRAAAALEVTAVAIAVGRGRVAAQVLDARVARGDLRQQSLAQRLCGRRRQREIVGALLERQRPAARVHPER